MGKYMHIHLDPVGGVAGDMFVSSLIDAFQYLENELYHTIKKLDIPSEIKIAVKPHTDGILTGKRFHVDLSKYLTSKNEQHSHFSNIKNRILQAKLPTETTERSIEIFHILALAEAEVHGTSVDKVTFHEVGAWDSIVDIVSAAFLVSNLSVKSWSISELPLGTGLVNSAHGMLPIPAPAVTSILFGYPVYSDNIKGERITPTGAAIIKHLSPEFDYSNKSLQLKNNGYGFGSKNFPNISNILRCLVFDYSENTPKIQHESIALINFEIDDQSPEDLAVGLEHLRSIDGVIDVSQNMLVMKKNRVTTGIQILAYPNKLNNVIKHCFIQTSTIGLRWQFVNRAILKRSIHNVVVDDQKLRIKCVNRDNATTAKVDIDDLNLVSASFAERTKLKNSLELEIIQKNLL
jgi:uncharacterized protein (TIGR00299 family) protein